METSRFVLHSSPVCGSSFKVVGKNAKLPLGRDTHRCEQRCGSHAGGISGPGLKGKANLRWVAVAGTGSGQESRVREEERGLSERLTPAQRRREPRGRQLLPISGRQASLQASESGHAETTRDTEVQLVGEGRIVEPLVCREGASSLPPHKGHKTEQAG